MAEDKNRPNGDANGDGSNEGANGQRGYDPYSPDQGQYGGGQDHNQHGQDPSQYGQDHNQYGQQNPGGYGEGQYGQDPSQYGQQNPGGYGEGQYGQDQYGQNQYGQNQYGQDQWGGQGGFAAGAAGGAGYQGQQGYQGYQGYEGQQYGAAGQGGGWQQGQFGDPGPGVDQPGGQEPPTSPVFSGSYQFNITQPLSTGFKRLNANIGPWLGFVALALVSIVVIMAVFFGVLFGGVLSNLSAYDPSDPYSTDPSAAGVGAMIGSLLLFYPVLFLVMFLMMVFSYRGAFEEIDGRVATFASFFRVTRWGSLIGGFLIVGLISFVAQIPGYLLMFGGLAASVQSEGAGFGVVMLSYLLILAGSLFVLPITTLVPLLIMDGRAKALEAPGVAWNLIKGRFWQVLGSVVLISIVGSLGAFACYIGLIYTLPLSIIAYVEMYRQLIGGRRPVPQA